MIATIPPRGHHAEASAALRPDGTYELRVGTAEFGNGTTTVHTQIAAAVLATEPGRIAIRNSAAGRSRAGWRRRWARRCTST